MSALVEGLTEPPPGPTQVETDRGSAPARRCRCRTARRSGRGWRRTPPAHRRGWRPHRCRSPRPARRRQQRSHVGGGHSGERFLDLAGGVLDVAAGPAAAAETHLAADVHTERLALVRRLLEQLSHREVLALAGSQPPSHHFPWASLGLGGRLTEDQEDFVDYWSPQPSTQGLPSPARADRRSRRMGPHSESPDAQEFVSRLLTAMVDHDGDDE